MKELDLRGVGLPISLLQCKNSLLAAKPEEEMVVLVRDPEVMEDLVKIIRRSHERPARSRRDGDHYRIHIGPTHSGPS
jgi:TusA-related sulfurtransferase